MDVNDKSLVFCLNRKPKSIRIIRTYFLNYGPWILASIIILYIIGVFNISANITYLFLIGIFFLLGYGQAYPSNKNIYKIVVSPDNLSIRLYYFVLWKNISEIPFSKLHIEFVKIKTVNNKEEWRIHFAKRPWPIVGIISSLNGYWSWDKKQMIELSKELYKIKQKHETWKPEKSFLQEPVGKIRSFERVEYFE
jgi:hypothetical protein